MHKLVRQGGHRFRRHVRRLWQSRGGGFYGFVATLTFLYLEVKSLLPDAATVRSVAQLNVGGIVGGVVSWFVNNLVTGIMNAVWSALWPVEWLNRFGVSLTSAALLLGAYLLFLLVRPAVLRLLREPDEALADLSSRGPGAAG